MPSAVVAGLAMPLAGAAGLAGVTAPPGYAAGARPTSVRTAAQLQAALATAVPGQRIRLAPGTYRGSFVVRRPGTATTPIVLTGSRKAILVNDGPSGTGPSCPVPTAGWDSGYGLWLFDAGYWRLSGFTAAESKKGIVLDNHATPGSSTPA